MPTKIVSFGFKYSIPELESGDDYIDVRNYIYANPFRVRELARLKGDDIKVIEYLEKCTANIESTYGTILSIAKKLAYGVDSILYIGCTGGKHRSVYIANRLGKDLGVKVEHRDYNRK